MSITLTQLILMLLPTNLEPEETLPHKAVMTDSSETNTDQTHTLNQLLHTTTSELQLEALLEPQLEVLLEDQSLMDKEHTEALLLSPLIPHPRIPS